MDRTLQDFPDAFLPLVVVVGDRREHRPKTRADLLAYSMSTVDILYIHSLGLPKNTLIVSDKVFALEKEEFLRRKFGRCNLLTIGSPATNLFSRRINSTSLFRFKIGSESIKTMHRLERIAETIKRDQLSLRIFKLILEEGAQTAKDIVKSYRYQITLNDYLVKRFDEINAKLSELGPINYRELIRDFEGKGILDPILNGKLTRKKLRVRGEILRDYNDFGFVSIAKHPFADGDDAVVIYTAGRHGPATSHSINFLSNHDLWGRRPLGGVFEVQMDISESFSTKFQEVTMIWDTEEYGDRIVKKFSTASLVEKRPNEKVSVFVSAPYRKGDKTKEKNAKWLAKTVTDFYRQKGMSVRCDHPYKLFYKGEWDFVHGILKHFPPATFILHDITNYSPGVFFEVGCSMGLSKRFVLFWNTSEADFDSRTIPKLLRFTNIRQISFGDDESAREEILDVLESIPTAMEDSEILLCPGSPNTKKGDICEYREHSKGVAPESNNVFVVVGNKYPKVKSAVIKNIRRHDCNTILPSDIKEEYVICRICRGVATCAKVVVDVSASDLDGLMALGMARARERRSLQLFEEGSKGSSMFEGLSCKWHKETIGNDIEEAVSRLLKVN